MVSCQTSSLGLRSGTGFTITDAHQSTHDYLLSKIIGQGSFSEVWLARNGTGPVAAVKVSNPRFSADCVERKELFYQQFSREQKYVQAASDECVLPYLGIGSIRNHQFIAYRFVPGLNLEDAVTSHTLVQADQQRKVFLELLDRVELFHKSFLHLDLKPANIWVADDSREIKLLDLGSSVPTCFMDASFDILQPATPAFSAPEVLMKEDRGFYSDTYSLGLILFFILTGTYINPLPGEFHIELTDFDFEENGTPERFIDFIRKATSLETTNRFQNVASLRAAFLELT